MSISEAFRNWFLEPAIQKLHETEKKIMAQIDDLNTKLTAIGAAIDGVGTDLAKATTDIQKSFADLKAAIGTGGTPDLTAQLQALDSNIAKLADISTAVKSVDTAAVDADPKTA